MEAYAEVSALFSLFFFWVGKQKIHVFTEWKKQSSYLYFLVRRPDCFLPVSKQILLLEDFSPSVITSFMLKQYKNIWSVTLCQPSSLLTVLQAVFGALLWKWNFLAGPPLACCCVRPVSFLQCSAAHVVLETVLACFYFNLLHGLWVQAPVPLRNFSSLSRLSPVLVISNVF